jgi:hypothetical protein
MRRPEKGTNISPRHHGPIALALVLTLIAIISVLRYAYFVRNLTNYDVTDLPSYIEPEFPELDARQFVNLGWAHTTAHHPKSSSVNVQRKKNGARPDSRGRDVLSCRTAWRAVTNSNSWTGSVDEAALAQRPKITPRLLTGSRVLRGGGGPHGGAGAVRCAPPRQPVGALAGVQAVCFTQFRVACAESSNWRASSSGVRPLRTSSTIRCRNSANHSTFRSQREAGRSFASFGS